MSCAQNPAARHNSQHTWKEHVGKWIKLHLGRPAFVTVVVVRPQCCEERRGKGVQRRPRPHAGCRVAGEQQRRRSPDEA